MPTILIVDDRPANREFLVTLLGYGGHRLLEAADGAEGLSITRAARPDLVIADILMPTMDGYEFVRQLRADPAIADTRVIFYTAHYHEPEARKLAAACGVSDVMTKPCEPELVLRTVNAALGNIPATSPASPPEEFDREHLTLLTDKLSQHADEVRRTNERLQAMVELGLQLGSERDPARLLQLFCDATRQIIGARYAMLGVPNGGSPSYRHFFTSGMDVPTASRIGRPGLVAGVLGSVLAAGRCFRANHGGLDAAGVPPSFPPATALLAAPVLSPARVHGWICLLDKPGADAFTDEDEQFARMLAAQVGRIYENGSLYADLLQHSTKLAEEVAERKRAELALAERVRLASLVGEVGLALIQRESLKDVLSRCADAVVRHLDAAFARIWTLSRDNLVLELQASAGMYTQLDGSHGQVPVGQFKIGLIAQERRPHLTNAVVGDPRVADQEWARREGMVAFAGYPLLVDDRLVGVVALFAKQELSETVLQSLGAVADQIALGIERKRSEHALQSSQQRLQYVVASSPAVLFTLAIDGNSFRLSWISDNVREMMGYTLEEVLQLPWWQDHLHPEEAEQVWGEVLEVFSRGNQTHEYRFRHKDKKYRWVRGEMRLFRDATGNPLEVIGSWSDITERKQLESQFRQAQKMEAVGQLAGGVAHDFNNLLTVINGYSELMLFEMSESHPNHQAISAIRDAGERAAGLTSQLLAFSRQTVLEPRILDPNTVVTETGKMLTRLIGEDIKLSTALDPRIGRVKVDPGQLGQVLMNLAVNARDAMPTGGRLTIETCKMVFEADVGLRRSEMGIGSYVMIAVSDTGCGMTDEVKSRVFEPFFTTKGEGKGTGLGLATVFGIIKQSGGHVEVYSEVGVGTTFKIYLPTVDESEIPSTSQDTAKVCGGKETILLVEDQADVRKLALIALQTHGYTVIEAVDGQDALRQIAQSRPRVDILVTDVVMPGMNGRQLAEALQTLDSGIKVLFMSGYTDDAVVRHGILQAEVAFLRKPYTPFSLARKVREVLDQS
jgi:PAS domain S-box-containing protein